MRILVALVMVSVSALAVDITKASPVEFSVAQFLDINAGRGGTDYTVVARAEGDSDQRTNTV